MEELQILIRAVIDEAKSLLGMKSQLDQMGDKLSVPVAAKLNKTKSRQQLKTDLSTLDKLYLNITGKLDRSKTKKDVKNDLKAIGVETIKLKTTVDTAALKKSLKGATDKSASINVDTNIDGAENLSKVADGMDNINRNSSATVASVTLLHQAVIGLERAAKKMVSTSAELDKKLTDLRMVTGGSYEDAQRLVGAYNELAKELGATTSEVLDASSEWLRQGMTAEQTATLIEQSMILSKVGAMGAETATKNLTSAMKGYGMTVEEVSGIVDRLTAIDLKAAVTASDLAVAMSRTANSANISGVSMDKLLGYLATVQEVTQKSAETIGESFKTIFARMGNVKLGNFLDDDGEDLSDVESVLKHFGIVLRDSKDEFRAFGDVLDDVYDKWNSFTNIDKRAIANAFAGVRQQENFLVLMENYGKALEYAGVAADSTGTAFQKFGAYQESLQAKGNEFTAAFESLSMNLLDAEFLGVLVDAGTAMLEFADNTNLLKTALAGLAAAGIVKGFTLISTYIKDAYTNVSKLTMAFDILSKSSDTGIAADQFKKLLSATDSLNASQLRLIISNKALTNEQRMAILMASGLTAEQAAQTLATMGLTAAETGATTATFSLTGAMKALTAAIAANPIGFLLVALTTAVTVISTVTNKIRQSQEEARQAIVAAGTAAKENAEGLYDLVTAYIDLGDAVDAGTATQEEFLSVQDDLIDCLGLEGKTVQELQGNYDSLRDSIIATARQQLQTDISTGTRASDITKEDAISEIDGYINNHSFYSATGEEAGKAMAYLKELGFTGIDDTGSKGGGTIFLPSVYSTNGGLEEVEFSDLLENYKYLKDTMNAVGAEFGSDNPVFEVLADAYTEYDAALKDAIEQIDATNEMVAYDALLAAQKMSNPKTVEEFESFRKGIIESVQGSLNYDSDGTYSVEGLVDKILGETDQYSNLLAALTEREISAKSVRDKMQTIAEALIPKDYEQYTPGTSAHFHALDTWTTQAEEVKQKLRELSDEDFEIAYNAVINEGATTWEDITAAIQKYSSEEEVANRKTNELQKSITGLWNSKDFADAKADLVAMSQTLDGITPQAIEDLASESDVLAGILEEDGMNAQFLAKIMQNMAEGGDGISLVTTEALKLNDALDGMVGRFDQVTDAKSRYDAAMSVEEKDTDFRSYAEAFAELNAQFEAGTTNSNAFWAAAEFLFGSEQLATWGWSEGLDEIYQAMEKNKKVFSDADSAGAGFIERLYQLDQAGKMVNEEGEKLLTIGKDASGAYFFDIDPENIEDIAEKMGITEEAALACLKALSMWGDINFYDLTEVADVIDEIGLSCETAAGKAINVDRLTEQLLTLGKTEKECHDIVTALGAMDSVQLFTITGEVDNLTQSLQDLSLATSDGVTITVDYEGLGDLLLNLGYTKDEAEELITKLGEADNITLANADGEIKDVSDALDYINSLTFTEVTASVSGVGDAVGDVDESSTDNVVSEVEAIGDAADIAVTKVYDIGTAIDAIDGKKATVYYDVKKKGSVLGSIFGFAKGTKNAPGGAALVGEEGAELVQNGDQAYLVGMHHPEIVHLDEGDQVYTAAETRQILSGSGKRISGTIPAYASGKVTTGGIYVQTNKTGETGTPYGVKVKPVLDDTELEKQLEDTLKKMEEDINEVLGNFEHNIFLLEKNDGTPEQIIEIYKAMQKEVHNQAEAYRRLGLDENSDYIQNLQKKWWDYQDTIEDMLHNIYKTSVEEHKNTLSYLESQYDALDSNRSGDAMTENLNKQLEAQRAIQRAAVEEADRLRAMGLDENDDAIQECIDTWWDAEGAIRDIGSQISHDVLDVFDDFIEYADEFDLWGNLDFTKVDYLKQKITAINKLFKDGVLTLKEYNSLLRETQIEIYNEQKEALTKIIEMTMELVRQEAEDKIDALKQQIEDYQKIIELKKQSLATSREEEDYEKEVAKRVAEIAEIQARIAQLDRDDSREANAEKQKLAQELTDLKSELADYQAEYSYEAQMEALDKEQSSFEDTKNQEIAKVEASVDTEEEVYNAAIARIDGNWSQLYEDLIEWNRQYGDMIDGEDSITSAWHTAREAAEEYGSVVSALNGINSDIAYEEEQIRNQQYTEDAIHKIIKEMYANSRAHGAADAAGKARLNKRNLELGAMLAQYGITAVRGNDGVWYVDRVGGEQLYDKYRQYTYHTGGIVGEAPALKSNEVLAKLEIGEVVLTKDDISSLRELVQSNMRGVVDALVGGLTASEPMASEVVKSITNNNGDTDNSVNEEGVVIHNEFHMQNVTEENMKHFADYYSDYTIDKLMSAAKRKGLKNSVGSHMLR